MVANDIQPGQSITVQLVLDGRWMWGTSCFFALLPFIWSRALRLIYVSFLHAFTKANDTPMDNYDTPGEEDTVVYSGICGFFYGVLGGELIFRDGMECTYYCMYCIVHHMYILRKSATRKH